MINPNALRQCIQKVATGPEYSKDLSLEEAHQAMSAILQDNADPVQAAVFLIALRMKRETDAENKGILHAIKDVCNIVTAEVDELIDIADPYDGYSRGVPVSAFLPALLAECGLPAVSHGLESVGPKYGVTHRMVLRASGLNVDLSPEAAAKRIEDPDIGWAYVDQKDSTPALHDLVSLRQRIVKRPVITTVEVLTGPIRAKSKTHLLTGYVHKAYPPIYAELARYSDFDSAIIVRGVEGGIIPSLKQEAKIHFYHDKGAESSIKIDPNDCQIQQETRAVPIPSNMKKSEQADDIANEYDVKAVAEYAAECGKAALSGKTGPAYDSLVYSASICLKHIGKYSTLGEAATFVRSVLDSGKVLKRL
ncbi:MAG: anthranilate phosphoribosyltransferase [Thiohalomonadales bacterium]